MAFNKKQTSLITRIGIVVVAIILVISFIPGLFGLFGSTGSTQQDTAAGTIDSISQQYVQQAQFNEQSLASDPTSYTVLVNQGNLYFDWALAVAETSPASAVPIWGQTTAYYERALQSKPGDPLIMTDMSIAYENLGRIDLAITAADAATRVDPPFSPAYYHLGRYLQTVGQSDGARAALEMYLQLDPGGQTPGGDPADAQARLSALPAAGAGATTPPSTPETKTP